MWLLFQSLLIAMYAVPRECGAGHAASSAAHVMDWQHGVKRTCVLRNHVVPTNAEERP